MLYEYLRKLEKIVIVGAHFHKSFWFNRLSVFDSS